MKIGELRDYFEKLRFDPNHHLGMGDIRLTMGQQEEILKMLEDEALQDKADKEYQDYLRDND